MTLIKVLSFAIVLSATIRPLSAQDASQFNDDYKIISNACAICRQLNESLEKFRVADGNDDADDDKWQIAFRMAREVTQRISLNGIKDITERRRIIYYAINATIEVMTIDFENENVIALMGLRKQSPKTFDEVLWRFRRVDQNQIIDRMKYEKNHNIHPEAEIPQPGPK